MAKNFRGYFFLPHTVDIWYDRTEILKVRTVACGIILIVQHKALLIMGVGYYQPRHPFPPLKSNFVHRSGNVLKWSMYQSSYVLKWSMY